jgi:hypothetical protein
VCAERESENAFPATVNARGKVYAMFKKGLSRERESVKTFPATVYARRRVFVLFNKDLSSERVREFPRME